MLRETLFNVWALRVEGARVLDSYAGTGAVGIEALSRGATEVVFVERDRRAVALIEANLAACGIERGYTIHCGDVASVLRRLPQDATFDLVFLDPPYEADSVTQALEAVAARLAEAGVAVLERATRLEPHLPSGFERIRDVTAGDSTLTFLGLSRSYR